MKSKKVYIGIAAIIVSILIVVIASIFYIKANQMDVEIFRFAQGMLKENTKEAMKETEQSTNDEVKKGESPEPAEQVQPDPEPQAEVTEQQEAEKVEVQEVKEQTEEKAENKEPEKEIEVTPASGKKYVKASSLNVRSGPDTSYSKVGALSYASEVEINGKSGDWYRISYSGKTGFVRGDYLTDNKPEQKSVEVSDVNAGTYSEASGTVSHLIIINSRNNTLRFYRDGNLVASYSCATGASGSATPQGKFAINEKIVNRPYYKAGIPGGAPNNPLGPRWMQFKDGGYGIHGTNVDSSIGTHASHGCVRMHNNEVIQLYSMVPMGTTVIVKNTSESDRSIAASYGIKIN